MEKMKARVKSDPPAVTDEAVEYVRVSSKEQEKEGYSIPAQQKLINDYAETHGLRIVKHFADAETAKASGRTQFDEMVKFLKTHPYVKKILVEKTDRLYRNFRDYVTLEELDREIHLVKEREVLSKHSKSHEKLVHGIKVVLAKNYLDNLSEEVRKGMREKCEQGGYPGKVPVGYKNNKDSHTVELDPEKAPFIHKLFEWYASGQYSLTQLRQKCMEAGFRTRRSAKRISRSNLEWILKNQFYSGFFNWNGRLYKGSYPPIVSQDLFQAVQDAFRRHNRPRGRYGRRFAFTGFLSCGRCGCSITAEIHKNKYVYYRCTGFKGRCGEGYMREEILQKLLGDLLKKIEIPMEKVQWIKEALRVTHAEQETFRKQTIESLEGQCRRLRDRIDRAYSDKLDGEITGEFWRTKSAEWQQEQEQLEGQLTTYKQVSRPYHENGFKILELANRAYSLYIQQPAHEKAKLLKIIQSNCTWDGINPYPTYKKPFDILAKGLTTQNWLGEKDSNPHSQNQNLKQGDSDPG